MSNFLSYPDDYKAQVKNETIMAVVRNDQTAIDLAETYAVSEMAGYVGTRYDSTAIFEATGTDRYPLLVMFGVDITLYHLFSSIPKLKVPDDVRDRYNRAIEWLQDLSDGKVAPPELPIKTDPDTGEDLNANMRWGSNDKFTQLW